VRKFIIQKRVRVGCRVNGALVTGENWRTVARGLSEDEVNERLATYRQDGGEYRAFRAGKYSKWRY
jgi:hypothetical protein